MVRRDAGRRHLVHVRRAPGDHYREAAAQPDPKRANPVDFPVGLPTHFEFVVNPQASGTPAYDAPMLWMIRCIAAFLAAMVLCAAGGAQTAAPQPAPTAALPEVTLKSLGVLFEQMPNSADSEDEIRHVTALTDEIAKQAEDFVAARTTQLADLNARLGELGPAPTAGGSAENLAVTHQRAALEKRRNALDAEIRLARLISVNAQQRRAEVLAQRRAVFEAQLFDHSDSPLGTAFWNEAGAQWEADQVRLDNLASEFESGLTTALRGAAQVKLLLGTLGVLAIVVVGLWLTESGLARLAARTFPSGRLRRSLLALLTALAYILIAGLALSLSWDGLEQAGLWGPQSTRLAESAVSFGMFLAFVVGLGRSLLANGRSSWRLPQIGDDRAQQLAPLPWLFAFAVLVAWLPFTLNNVLETPLNSVISNLAPTIAFAIACVIGLRLLRRSHRAPYAEAKSHDAPQPPGAAFERPVWLGLLIGLVVTLLVALLVMVAAGYLALARVVAGQATWAGIVLASAYLLFKFADDLCMALLSSRSGLGQRLRKGLGVAPQTLDQAAVLLSGFSRISVLFYMAIAFVAPLGSSPGQLFHRSGKFGSGLKVGEFELMPGAILSFLVVLGVGYVVLRLFKHWLKNSYLPNTKLESGMRSSLSTLLGYVGGIVVIAFALSALGISINRIAWIASALSVGIGFGLQAIVQNFISGLILLAERPVKVGDWVVLGASEGDVRRINVRATEIQLGDRSTLIVPNSEFITKTVRNMTLANAEGRVLIRLPMPLSIDAQRVREIMLGAFREHEAALPAPAPGVTLDGIENGLLIFQGIAYVPSPRQAAEVRSDLLFTILERLQTAQVPMAVYAGASAPGAMGPSLAPDLSPPRPPPPLPGTATD
jgi:potassium-dependent mechanosensitive channel